MAKPPGDDPRTEPAIAAERDIRPIVAKPRSGLSGWAIGAIMVVAAIALFFILDARRRARLAPAVAPRTDLAAESAAPPPLYVPPESSPPTPVPTPVPTPSPAPPPAPPPPPQIVYTSPPAPAQPEPAAAPPRNLGGPALVVDNGASSVSTGADQGAAKPPGTGGAPLADTARVRTASLANRTMTVPQGTLIPAVLETALDSSKAGFARALVQRDVRGFDGTRVLIPRGSRLIGQYEGDAAQGQKRAFIMWTRLIRPDGVTIALASPVTDPVGGGGVHAHVNSHFFARFTGAILQSLLDVGVNLASRSSNAPVLVALPGSVQGTVGTTVQPSQVTPTLTVKPGTSISIFVARDLDFSGAGNAGNAP